ncbi:MAG: aminotransferase class V-fold PLP-dependent enzyme [Propionibacteriaceae bacterium]|nr:aminotransferase class V-fold PLP-dependent enzyme [Propionibacteriaceae bacterium]
MSFQALHDEMNEQVANRLLFEQAQQAACAYLDGARDMDAFPSSESLALLGRLDEPMPTSPTQPTEILRLLNEVGSPNTVGQNSGRYFGFVNGGVTPVAVAAKWLADAWDQNAALYVMSPIAAKLEEICEKWIVELLGLPDGTAAGFVSGSSTAIICGLAAARNTLLARQGWDVAEHGLFGAPPIRIIVGEQAHSSVWKALSMLGLGKANAEIVPADEQGRIIPSAMPPLDSHTLVILQAGNVNGGAFDAIDEICDAANQAGAWVHIDGAFGLWAAACEATRHLVQGMAKADSWSADAHKTLNAPYDCGIVMCKDRAALTGAMQATGSYLQFSDNRDGMLYTPEMSRRARSIELWATLKFFGKDGVDQLVSHLCEVARYFAAQLTGHGFVVLNDVVFNQIVMRCDDASRTTTLLEKIQSSGKCWCGGATWGNQPVIRLSVSSWQTTTADIDECVALFVEVQHP